VNDPMIDGWASQRYVYGELAAERVTTNGPYVPVPSMGEIALVPSRWKLWSESASMMVIEYWPGARFVTAPPEALVSPIVPPLIDPLSGVCAWAAIGSRAAATVATRGARKRRTSRTTAAGSDRFANGGRNVRTGP
jgi:hypothetical protein